ncbi:pyruvate flavodoxin/ferredoxin oxidoreductase domain protein [Staphylothermus hellenicus DSM 12710]|uniref:2-oxoacid oxidoreductase (ferredoxin) n=2 Tax=Staphylothermus hellenicus TaxID=84599 RepID=D7D8L4_STAHD|nr:pyruvate flavodoxin/ferredoxin oxidoreductase domain protein [Staphylothermus hellenicus DSM 12710]
MGDPRMAAKNSIQVLIAGPAGSGNITSGLVIARALHKLGYHVIGVSEYPSLIRGGHTVYWVRAGVEKIYELYRTSDYIVTFDETTYTRQEKDFRGDSIVVFDPDLVKRDPPRGIKYEAPMRKIIREYKLKPITTNMLATGVIAGLMGIPLEEVAWSIKYQFRGKEKVIEENVKAAMIGYEYVAKHPLTAQTYRLEPSKPWGPRILLTGNEAIGLGFVKGDLRLYVAYPMTPASPLLHFMVRVMKDKNIPVIQAENEIAAAQMALAATWAGVRAATGTSGGGFALMNETLSEAGMLELPLTIVLAMRPGPSTGMATHSAQEDMLYSLFAGHGEFPRIVVAPADQEDAYYRAVEVLNLGWKYRVPAIILVDKHLAESIRSVPAFREDLSLDYGALIPREEAEKRIGEGWEFKPYMDTETGVPPWVPPGTKGALVKADSSEHDERGIVTEDPVNADKQYRRRMRKEGYLRRELEEKYEVLRVYGEEPDKTDLVILTWGSAAWASLEAKKLLSKDGVDLSIVQVIYLWPFPRRTFIETMKKYKDKPIVTVEYNYRGQLGILAYMETGVKTSGHIGKVDGRPFRAEDLASKIKEFLKS